MDAPCPSRTNTIPGNGSSVPSSLICTINSYTSNRTPTVPGIGSSVPLKIFQLYIQCLAAQYTKHTTCCTRQLFQCTKFSYLYNKQLHIKQNTYRTRHWFQCTKIFQLYIQCLAAQCTKHTTCCTRQYNGSSVPSSLICTINSYTSNRTPTVPGIGSSIPRYFNCTYNV